MKSYAQLEEASLKAVIAAVSANFLVTIAKFIGWTISFSPSMLAETIHSLADVLNQFLLFIGIRHGSGRPTKTYPFGKGQARYVWNLISAMGIFFVGFGVTTYHGISELVAPSHATHTINPFIPISILIFSFFVEGYSLYIAFKSITEARGDKTLFEYIRMGDDPTTVGVLLEDFIAVFGVLLALAGLALSHVFHSEVPDSIASILIGCLLGLMAITLAMANGRILMGASAGVDIESELREYVETYPTVERVTALRTAVLSPGRLRLSLEVEFHGGILIDRQQIERDAERIRDGEDPAYILFETSERMVRLVGRSINLLEADIHKNFPEVIIIDLEVN
jgi:zinc transporter 9